MASRGDNSELLLKKLNVELVSVPNDVIAVSAQLGSSAVRSPETGAVGSYIASLRSGIDVCEVINLQC